MARSRTQQWRAAELLDADRRAGDDHVQCGFGADEAWQTLGAAGTGQQSQLDLRQCESGTCRGDAVVAAERELQTAAHANAIDGRDDGLGALLDRTQYPMEVRGGECLRRAEFTDIGAAGEALAGADEEHGLYGRIVLGTRQCCDDRTAQLVPKAVDRRIIQAQHGDCAADFEVHVTHADAHP
jgi:hypothetical protein